MIHCTSVGIPFVPVLWVLKSAASVSSKIRLGTPNVLCFSISENVHENPDLTAVVAIVGVHGEEPSANDYREGIEQRQDNA